MTTSSGNPRKTEVHASHDPASGGASGEEPLVRPGKVHPLVTDEKTVLLLSLRRHRAAVRWKLEALDDEQLRRPMVPSGTNLLGLVKHLAGVEYGWFCLPFDVETEPLPFDEDDENADLRVRPDETTADVLAFYDRACAASDAVLESRPLDAIGTSWAGDPVTLRWIAVHMIEETARHAGHMDILRELLDGSTGDHNRSSTE